MVERGGDGGEIQARGYHIAETEKTSIRSELRAERLDEPGELGRNWTR